MNRLSEQLAVVSVIDPDAYAASTVNGDVIDMNDHEEVVFIVSAGTLGSSATVDYKVMADTASGGSFTTALTGKAITQFTDAGTDSDKQAIITVSQDEVTNQGMRYIQDELIVAVATSDVGAIALASTRYTPASEYDLASVDEIVN